MYTYVYIYIYWLSEQQSMHEKIRHHLQVKEVHHASQDYEKSRLRRGAT